jgi:hypothetical protein
MWLLLICVAIVSTWAIVAAVHSATENIIGGLRAGHMPHTDGDINKYDLHSIELALKEIKELLSISCPQCGDEPWFSLTVAEQRVWLEEHVAEHKSGKLEGRALDDIVAERHAERARKHKEFEASHPHLFTPGEEENEAGAAGKTSEEKN